MFLKIVDQQYPLGIPKNVGHNLAERCALDGAVPSTPQGKHSAPRKVENSANHLYIVAFDEKDSP